MYTIKDEEKPDLLAAIRVFACGVIMATEDHPDHGPGVGLQLTIEGVDQMYWVNSIRDCDDEVGYIITLRGLNDDTVEIIMSTNPTVDLHS